MVGGSYGFHSRSVYCVNPLTRSVECMLDLHVRGPGIQTQAEAISASVASGFHLSTLWVLRDLLLRCWHSGRVEDNSFFEGARTMW